MNLGWGGRAPHNQVDHITHRAPQAIQRMTLKHSNKPASKFSHFSIPGQISWCYSTGNRRYTGTASRPFIQLHCHLMQAM